MYKSHWKLNKEKELKNNILEGVFTVLFLAGLFTLLDLYLIALR